MSLSSFPSKRNSWFQREKGNRGNQRRASDSSSELTSALRIASTNRKALLISYWVIENNSSPAPLPNNPVCDSRIQAHHELKRFAPRSIRVPNAKFVGVNESQIETIPPSAPPVSNDRLVRQ